MARRWQARDRLGHHDDDLVVTLVNALCRAPDRQLVDAYGNRKIAIGMQPAHQFEKRRAARIRRQVVLGEHIPLERGIGKFVVERLGLAEFSRAFGRDNFAITRDVVLRQHRRNEARLHGVVGIGSLKRRTDQNKRKCKSDVA